MADEINEEPRVFKIDKEDAPSLHRNVYNFLHTLMEAPTMFAKAQQLVSDNMNVHNNTINVQEILYNGTKDVSDQLRVALDMSSDQDFKTLPYSTDITSQIEIYDIAFRQAVLSLLIEKMFNKFITI